MTMTRDDLTGRNLLIVEDEPLIALDIAMTFEAAGAKVTTTNTLTHALLLAEHDSLSAVIVDHILSDGDSDRLCRLLKDREIPFVMYSGLTDLPEQCADAPRVPKPSSPSVLLEAIARLLKRPTQA